MKDINALLTKLITESNTDILISSPNDISGLQKDGLKLDQPTLTTPQEYIDKLFETKKKLALESINIVPNLVKIHVPTINLLYQEISECVLFGLNGAAISLSAILVEYALKRAIVKVKYGNEYKAEEWDRIEHIEFGPAIKEAKALGLLDDAITKKFQDFKDQIRNPYLHYNIKKLTKDVRANKVKRLNLRTQEVEEVQLDTENDPILWPYAKKYVDKVKLKSILTFTCFVVNLLLNDKKEHE